MQWKSFHLFVKYRKKNKNKIQSIKMEPRMQQQNYDRVKKLNSN